VSNVFGITARAFRFYEDGTEAGSTAIAAENTNITRDVAAGNSALQLRYGVQESGSGSASGATTDDYQLQVSKNAGAYANVAAASSNVRAFPTANLTDAAATTQRLSAGSGAFIAGEIDEADGIVTDWQLTANNFSELLYSVELVAADLAHNDTLDFRVLRNGAVFNTYSVTPRVTANKFSQNLDHPLKRLAVDLGATFGVFFDVASGNLTDFIAGKTGTANGTPTYGAAATMPNGRTAIDFAASGDFFTFDDHADLDVGAGPVTIMCGAARDEDLATWQGAANKGTNGYVFEVGSDDRWDLAKDGVAILVRSSSTVPADGSYHTYAGTLSGGTGAGRSKLYVDAVDVTVETDTTTQLADTTAVLTVGRQGTTNRFGGKIAFILIFKSVLTAAQIQALHDAALRGPLETRQMPQLLAA